jgi:3-oxoacyl-(acyl-carrier-protein) synthase
MNGAPVITGMGFVTCLGHTRTAVAAALQDMRHGLSEWRSEQASRAGVRLAGVLRGFDVEATNPAAWSWPVDANVKAAEVRGMPPHGVYALAAVRQALAEAKLRPNDPGDGGTGLACASGGSPRMLFHHLRKLAASGWTKGHPNCILGSVAGSLNFHLSAHLGIRGSSCSFSSACASGGHALGYALDEIRFGRQERMIVIGAEDLNAESLLPFTTMGVLSRSGDPAKASRPFDREREGFVGTGGAVALIIENPETAASRGARPIARLTGWGQSCDGHHPAMPHPEGRGLTDAMRRALRDARITPADVDHVNAHAAGTPAGDRAEARALRAVFGPGHRPAVCSTKALTGHGLSLAGVMEAAFCALAIDEGFIPGQAHLAEPDEDSALLHLPRETLRRKPRAILTNSSGFGGSNVVIVLESPAAA